MEMSFKHMDHSDAVEAFATEAFGSVLEKYNEAPVSFRAIFSVNRKFQSVHISTHLKTGNHIELEQGEDNIYKAIELVSDRLDRELSKHKTKRLSLRHKETLKGLEIQKDSDDDEVFS